MEPRTNKIQKLQLTQQFGKGAKIDLTQANEKKMKTQNKSKIITTSKHIEILQTRMDEVLKEMKERQDFLNEMKSLKALTLEEQENIAIQINQVKFFYFFVCVFITTHSTNVCVK